MLRLISVLIQLQYSETSLSYDSCPNKKEEWDFKYRKVLLFKILKLNSPFRTNIQVYVEISISRITL